MLAEAASLALTLATATPASASVSASATLAPIVPGSYLLTVTNTGSEPFSSIVIVPEGFAVSAVVPASACQVTDYTLVQLLTCAIEVAPAASAQVCYTGNALGAAVPQFVGLVKGSEDGHMTIKKTPAVASCSLSGFVPAPQNAPASNSRPRSGGTSGSSGTKAKPKKHAPPWSHAKCKSTYKAWTKKHRHATRAQKKAEANALHKSHGCPLSILK